MKQSRTIGLFTGGAFIILGLLLLGSLVNLFERSVIYAWVLPLIFIISGFNILQDSTKSKTGLGYGLIGAGAIGLLVRLGVLDGAFVNALLSAVLIAAGSALLVRNWQNNSSS